VAEWFRAQDLKSGDPWFKSYSYLDLFSIVPSSTHPLRSLNSKPVSHPPIRFTIITSYP